MKINNKQFDNFKHELQEKDETINALKLDNIEFKKQLKQYQIKFDEFETKVKNQNINIQQLQHQLQIKTQFEEEEKEQKHNKNCQHM
ncbi:hypothetical protein RFI_36700, partial [Reticulomyxa filosa]